MFITLFGSFRFQRLLSGISLAPEHFQRRINQVPRATPGVLCHINDILNTRADLKEHRKRLEDMLARLTPVAITLNYNCEFAKTYVTLGENSTRPKRSKSQQLERFIEVKQDSEMGQSMMCAGSMERSR